MFHATPFTQDISMIPVTTTDILLHEKELHWEFIHASGPGGQHVNKTASTVQLRFNIAQSPSLPEDVRDRLRRIPDRRITAAGVLIITARRFRSQEKNRQDALGRLITLIRKAAAKPRIRRATKPPQALTVRRLETKHRRGRTKHMRKTVTTVDD